MESIIIDIKSKKDEILLTALANRLHLNSTILTKEEREEIGLLRAMEEGKESGKASEDEIIAILSKWL